MSIGARVPEVSTRLCAPRARSRNAMAGFRLHRHSWTTSALDEMVSSWLEPLRVTGHLEVRHERIVPSKLSHKAVNQ